MGSGLSSPKPKYDSNQQKQNQVTRKVAEHGEHSRGASPEKQVQTKINMRKQIKGQLHYITGEYLNAETFNKHTMPLILDGMDNLLYLKARKWSEPSEKLIRDEGYALKDFIPKYAKKYPKLKEKFLEYGENVAHSRICAKAHYPSDKQFGKVVANRLLLMIKN